MNKENLTQLTIKLYSLTLLFPKKEPLRYKLRELADETFTNYLRVNNSSDYKNKGNLIKGFENPYPQVLESLEMLDALLEIAKVQNWVSPSEILNLQGEYNKIRKDIETPIQLPQHYETQGNENSEAKEAILLNPASTINERQRKILEILKEKEKVQAWELKRVIPEVSKRTIRRDFEHLLRQGLIARIGERNDTFYQLKVGQNNR